MVKSWWVLLFA